MVCPGCAARAFYRMFSCAAIGRYLTCALCCGLTQISPVPLSVMQSNAKVGRCKLLRVASPLVGWMPPLASAAAVAAVLAATVTACCDVFYFC